MTDVELAGAQPAAIHHRKPANDAVVVHGDLTGIDFVPELWTVNAVLYLGVTPSGLALLRRMVDKAESMLPPVPGRRGLMRFER